MGPHRLILENIGRGCASHRLHSTPADARRNLFAEPLERSIAGKEPAARSGVHTLKQMETADSPLKAAAGGGRPIKLRMVNVSKTYSNPTQSIEALQPVNVEIAEGEF